MLKLVVYAIIFAAACFTQVVLTCRATDDSQINLLRLEVTYLSQEVEALKNQSRENQQKEQIYSLTQEVEALKNQSRQNQQQKEQISSLSQKVEALKNQSRINQQFLDLYSKRLYVPPHFYVYQLTPGRQSWQKSQQYCQNWGGNLAVYGVQSMENRKTLIRILPINYLFWIGLNDIASEGNWIWVNGERANSSEIIWSQPPDNYAGNEDCVVLHGGPTFSGAGLAGDVPCSSIEYKGLCEKKV